MAQEGYAHKRRAVHDRDMEDYSATDQEDSNRSEDERD